MQGKVRSTKAEQATPTGSENTPIPPSFP
ncbi:MAG: hypothetical protein ACI9AO_001098, partial [Ilumatobacter sp.]